MDLLSSSSLLYRSLPLVLPVLQAGAIIGGAVMAASTLIAIAHRIKRRGDQSARLAGSSEHDGEAPMPGIGRLIAAVLLFSLAGLLQWAGASIGLDVPVLPAGIPLPD